MKVWKSPVLYFGILLVIAVCGLLLAPFVIDWNSYRADLEDYGRKLTGRTVKIEGGIAARLFPWPRLTVDDVHIGNPPGLAAPEFAHAERIVVRLTLEGLFHGDIDVASIDVERPVIGLERLATGEGNWLFTPAADIKASKLLSRVSLDRITLSKGTLRFSDRRRGGAIELTDLEASLASPAIAGPWRMRSVAQYGGRAVDISVNTSVWREDEPFRFGIRAAAADGSGLVFNFDGAQQNGAAEGQLQIEPAAAREGKGDSEGQMRPLVFTAKVKADFNRVEFNDIEIAPSDPKLGGVLTTGTASLTLGQHISARAELTAPTLDFDDLAGAQSRQMLREAGSLALANRLLDLLPKDTSLSGVMQVTALKVGGETLDGVKLTLDADDNAIRIGEFSAGLPGRSKALFKGVFFPGASGAELAGELAVESNDVRQLASWAWPDGKDALATAWTGSRGRLKLQTGVALTQSRFQLSKAEYELDGESGSVDLSVSHGGRTAVDIRIDARRLDIDNFLPGGLTALPAGGGGLGGLLTAILPRQDAADLRLTLQARELLINRVTATEVALDLASGSNGLDLRTLAIGSVGGARLEATGLIIDSGKGADGAIGLDINAADPRELLRLLGLVRGEENPAWSMGLGPMAVKGDFTVKPGSGGSSMHFGLNGTAGGLTIAGKGEIGPALDISMEGKISSPSSERLMQLAGLQPAIADRSPGEINVKADGTLSGGFKAETSLTAYGARLGYDGLFDPAKPRFGLDGKISLRSTDAASLTDAMGFPAMVPPAQVMVLDTAIKTMNGVVMLPDIGGRVGAAKVSGRLDADAGGRVSGQIETGELSLRDVLAPLFLTWSGPAPGLEASFAAGLPFGLTGEVWLKPARLAIHPHFVARNAEIGIMANTGQIEMALFGKDETGRDAHIEIVSKGSDSSRKLSGKISIPVILQNQLALTGGAPIAEGQGMVTVSFESDGRSPGGALASLRGSGAYDIDGFRLLGLSPSAFTERLATARDAAGIATAFEALRGGGLEFGRIQGAISVANGEVSLAPFKLSTADAEVEVRTVAELALGEIDADIAIALKSRPGLPPMNISYAGPPAQLTRNEDSTELSTNLGVTFMQQGIDELERLQQEQKRLAELEEKQRIDDEARLAAYYAQRDELLLRKRELKVHAEMRVAEAERLRQKIEAERAANAEINKSEVKQRVREIRLYRRLARVTTGAVQKPRPQRPVQRQTVNVPPSVNPVQGPLILAEPEGAPVVISAPPGAPPSQ